MFPDRKLITIKSAGSLDLSFKGPTPTVGAPGGATGEGLAWHFNSGTIESPLRMRSDGWLRIHPAHSNTASTFIHICKRGHGGSKGGGRSIKTPLSSRDLKRRKVSPLFPSPSSYSLASPQAP